MTTYPAEVTHTMREKLNENPVAQLALIGALALVVGFLLLHGFGGGGGEESETGEAAPPAAETATSTETPTPESGVIASEPTAATTSVQLPVATKMPKEIEAAYKRGDTIALLVYRPGGIDDKLTRESAELLKSMSGVAFFETNVEHIARYAEITGPLGVTQAPALIVVSPKRLSRGGVAPATVEYGFQTGEDVRQAIVDSRYEGPALTYAPN